MSLNTWKEDHYSVSAEEAAKLSWVGAVEHGLSKWEGFLPENLESHHVSIKVGKYPPYLMISDNGSKSSIAINDGTCALCLKCKNKDGAVDCRKCPIFGLTGSSCDEFKSSPFQIFVKYMNPEPMIGLLRRTLDFVRGETYG